jgi:CDGSH-type Zn-finger protein
MSETAVKIALKPNGPLRVEGLPSLETSVSLIDVDGTEFDLTGKPGISLCRCGGSANKPFCDGTHAKIGFQAADPSPLPKR